MYWLQLYNIGPDGEPVTVIKIGDPFPLAVAAIGAAQRLALATHFWITSDSGDVVLRDAI